MLFQDARLLPWQRVIDNVGIARGPDWRRRAEAVLADVGLGDRAGDWPAVLSGGQRQRVALARALVSRPRLLLLDEPFGALDALTRMEMHDLLARIWARERFTTVLITHDVVEAVTLADRVLVLKDGRFALDLPVEARRPRAAGRSARAAAGAPGAGGRLSVFMDGTDLRYFVERLRLIAPEPRLAPDERRRLFLEPRCHGAWLPQDVPDALLEEAWELARMGPTSANGSPLRLVLLRSEAEKARLLPALDRSNREKSRLAPVVAILAHDRRVLAPAATGCTRMSTPRPGSGTTRRSPARRRSATAPCRPPTSCSRSARWVPTSAPSPASTPRRVQAEFLAGTTLEVNFICNIGYGDPAELKPRLPRLTSTEIVRSACAPPSRRRRAGLRPLRCRPARLRLEPDGHRPEARRRPDRPGGAGRPAGDRRAPAGVRPQPVGSRQLGSAAGDLTHVCRGRALRRPTAPVLCCIAQSLPLSLTEADPQLLCSAAKEIRPWPRPAPFNVHRSPSSRLPEFKLPKFDLEAVFALQTANLAAAHEVQSIVLEAVQAIARVQHGWLEESVAGVKALLAAKEPKQPRRSWPTSRPPPRRRSPPASRAWTWASPRSSGWPSWSPSASRRTSTSSRRSPPKRRFECRPAVACLPAHRR